MKLSPATAIITLMICSINGQEQESTCGRRLVHHQALVTNGFDSKPGDWPWHAAIFHVGKNINIEYRCGGTVLNSNSILTAAHCVFEFDRLIIPERVVVHLGKYNLKVDGANTQQFEAFNIIAHSNFDTTNFLNDIAIIRTSTAATFNNYVQPICLWDSTRLRLSEVEGKLGTVVGWGLTETDHLSPILKQAYMPVVPLLTCLESNRMVFGNFLSSNNFCAGFRNGTGVCKGDSGGSIIFEENGVYYIRGIVSLTVAAKEKSCDPNEYVLFTDVAQYLPWIEKTLSQLSHRSQLATISTTLSPIATPNPTTSARISVKKCNEYKEFAYDKVLIRTVSGQPPVERKVSNCGFSYVPLIIGGIQANKGEFPHMALIGFKNADEIKWLCGGTLISDQFVLSAASCSNTYEYGPAKYVRLGEHDLERTDDGLAIDFNIVENIPHPDYKPRISYNDIVLFKLERRVEFNGAIRPACLPEHLDVPTRKAIATGWGTVKFPGKSSNLLLKVVLDVFTQNECYSFYSQDISRRLNKGIVEESQFCAGSHTEEKDTCQGDSGGPLQIYHDTHFCTYTIVGITSFGKGCATGTPGVFTRVYAYLDWIESTVWSNVESTVRPNVESTVKPNVEANVWSKK